MVKIPADMVAWQGDPENVQPPPDWDHTRPVLYGDGTLELMPTTWGSTRWLPGGGAGRIVAYYSVDAPPAEGRGCGLWIVAVVMLYALVAVAFRGW